MSALGPSGLPTVLSIGSSVIGNLRIELDTEGLLSLSKLERGISPLTRRGDAISSDDLLDMRLGGGGGGGAAELEEDDVIARLTLEGMDVEEILEPARFLAAGKGGGDLILGVLTSPTAT